MMETSKLSPWGVLALALVAACALAPGDEVARPEYVPIAGTPMATLAVEPAPPVIATASVCIYCTGVGPADGHVYATIYLTIDARVAIADLRVASFELLDARGAVVAHGAPPGYVAVVPAAHPDVGPFSGRLEAGARTVLWMPSRLDVGDQALKPLPTHYRLHFIANGTPLTVGGAMEPQGATA